MKLSDLKERPFNFLSLSIITLLLNFASGELLDFEYHLANSLAEQLSHGQVEAILNLRQKWQWLGLLAIPLLLLIKISLIALVLDIGLFFFNKRMTYKKLFGLVVKAEFIFLVVVLIKTLWFGLFQTDYTFTDLQYFYPLSALNLIGHENLEPWFIYPFQVLNLFQVTYWFVLAWLLGRELEWGLSRGLKVVLSSYGACLLIWIVTVMFLTLNAS